MVLDLIQDSPIPTIVVDGVVQPVAYRSAEQELARRNELKARGTLLMALPDKHQLKFNSHKDAKTLMEAIENRFGGNTETKKVQKTLLKQQCENFTGSSSKNLDQIHDRLQKLVSQLKIHKIDVDDLKDMDLRWQMAMLTMRARRFLQKTSKNLGDNRVTSMGFDMLKVEGYNCHRKGHFGRECRSPKDSRRSGATEPQRRTALVKNSTSNALVSQCDGLESVKARLVVYKQNESILEENIKLLNIKVLQPNGGYHTVPTPITGTFMPLKPDLVFHTAPIDVETDHSAFTIQLSPSKPTQDLSHTNRPSAPIIEDWISDSEDESETNDPQSVPSFVQSSEQVKTPRHSVQPIEASILDDTLKPTSPKSNSSSKRRNRKTCFNASFSHKHPPKHMVPVAVLTQSKPVSFTDVRPVCAVVPKIMVTRPRHAHSIDTKSNSPIRRHITHSLSLKTSNSPPRVTTAQAPMASAAKGKKGKWAWRPKCPTLDHDFRTSSELMILKRFDYNDALGRSKSDKGVIDSGCSRHMIGNMSYLSDFKELNGRYVAFEDGDVALDGKEHEVDTKKPESAVNVSPSSSAQSGKQDYKTKKKDKGKSSVESFTRNKDLSAEFEDHSDNSSNDVNAAGSIVPTAGQISSNSTNPFSAVGPSNTTASPTHGKYSFKDASQLPDNPDMLEMKRITYSDHENEELLRFKMQKVWILVDLPHGKRAIGTKWVYKKKDERGIVVRNKAIRLFLAYASFMGFMVYQMDVKSAFLYGTIEEEVYVCQPTGFEDPDHPDKVYKVVNALYGLYQAPRAWYETLANYLLESGFHRGKIDQTLFIKKEKGDILLVQIYVDDIIFGATNKDLCKSFKKLMKDKFQMSSMGELTFYLVLKSNDVTRLQALVHRKKVVITEATIRDVLCLDDAEGVDCLPNEEIFAELARMGYEKSSIKLTLYKAFFSSQWKFLIHTILQSMSAKRTSWNEFSSAMAYAVICLSTGRQFNFSKYVFENLVRNVDSSSKFYMYPRVGKGFLRAETPLFDGMLVAREPKEQGDAEELLQDNVDDVAQGADTVVLGDDVHHTPPQSPPPQPQSPPPAQPHAADFPMSLLQEALDTCATLTRRVEHLEHDKVAQALEITKLKKRVKKLKRDNKGRMIADLDRDTGVALMDDEGTEKKAEDAHVAGDEKVKGRQAKIYQIDMGHAPKVLSMQEDEPEVESVAAASATIAAVLAATITAAPVRVVAASTRRRKEVVIRDPEEESTAIIPAKTKSKDKGKGIMVEEPKPMKKKQQVKMDKEYARKLHEELNKDIDWSVAIDHVKQKAKEDSLDYFKEISYDDIRPIFESKFNSNIEFLLKTKEQVEEEENKAIESINETPAQKAAKRRKLNEEVKDLKQHLEIVPDEDDDVYTEATPLARKVSVVDYRIIQLNNKPHYKIIRADETHQLAMFERPDGQDQVWKNQMSVHGQSKVERRYPLSRFTLDQMLNAVRLRVEEQSEMSLELLSAAKQKLMLLDSAAERRLMLLSHDKTVNDKCCC
uniref:Putative ribonuclease H-like domain-containing protein n=1 Tax=Tanacetum cinerariifolium TaxID=118510 RepID=A0A6L2P061_TANCI|nr:putative ribonuclease H-like domain-containing protein [Tanacetum cinerariifolium]